MSSKKLYKCEYDVQTKKVGSTDTKQHTCYIVASSLANAADVAEKGRRRNIDLTELSRHVTVADTTDSK